MKTSAVKALGFIRFIRTGVIDPNRPRFLERRNRPPACFPKQGRSAFVACKRPWKFRNSPLLDAGLLMQFPLRDWRCSAKTSTVAAPEFRSSKGALMPSGNDSYDQEPT